MGVGIEMRLVHSVQDPKSIPPPKVTRVEAERLLMLKNTPVGTFLVRNSSQADSVRWENIGKNRIRTPTPPPPHQTPGRHQHPPALEC